MSKRFRTFCLTIPRRVWSDACRSLAGSTACAVVCLSVLISTAATAQPGRVVVTYHGGIGSGNETIWLVRQDCRLSYKTAIFDHNRFAFESVLPGSYMAVGYETYTRWSPPTEEFRVEPGATVTVSVYVNSTPCPSNDGSGSCEPTGGVPLNGRIVDEDGQPVVGATVIASRLDRISAWPSAATMSGPDGRFGYCEVAPGKLMLTVQQPTYRTRTMHLNLGAFNYSAGQLEIRIRRR